MNHASACEDVIVGTGTQVMLSELYDNERIRQCLNNTGLHYQLYNANWIEVRGKCFKLDCIVLPEIDEDEITPVFFHVQNMFCNA